MNGLSRKLVLLIAVIAVVGAASAVAYVGGFPPFERRGDISAESVCETLGDGEAAASELAEVLPDEPEYSFEDRIDGRTVTQGGSSFTADCLVRGGGSVLLSARTQMMVADPDRDWAAEALGDYSAAERADSFEAGSMGVLAGGRAAVLVPCSAPGSVIGGSYSLSVVVDLKQQDASAAERVRQGLADLAVGAARYAHRAAGCDVPSRLPSASPRLGGGA